MAQGGGAMDSIVWIITLFLLGSLGVLVVMNPKGFSKSAGAIFGGFNSWATTLSGSGYKGKGGG
jgi:hypothetical protein